MYLNSAFHNRRNSTMWLCCAFFLFSICLCFPFSYTFFYKIRAAITPVDEIVRISYDCVLYQQLTYGLNNNKLLAVNPFCFCYPVSFKNAIRSR